MHIGSFEFSLRELAGSMGDFGTLFPLAIGYIVVCGMNPAGFLVMMGLTNIALGLIYKLPISRHLSGDDSCGIRSTPVDRDKCNNAIQSSQSVEVAFDKSISDLESLQSIAGVSEVKKEGDKLKLYTNKPGDIACQLVEYANAHELQVLALNTLGPSLEDVFVHLTDTKGEQNAS